MKTLVSSRFSRHVLRAIGLFAALSCAPVFSVAAQISIVGNTIEEDAALPGESYSRSVVISNTSTDPQTVRIYQTDYSFKADGTSLFDSAGTSPRSNAKWLTAINRVVVLAPRSETSIAYSVRVPNDASLKGSYWSLIMIEGAPDGSARGGARKAQVAVGAVTRYAVQVATHIGSTGGRAIALVAPAVSLDEKGTPGVTLEVRNIGDRAYRPRLWIELYDATGTQKGRVEQQRGLIYPGTSVQQRFVLGKLPSGRYKALVFADTGDPTVFAKQFNIEL